MAQLSPTGGSARSTTTRPQLCSATAWWPVLPPRECPVITTSSSSFNIREIFPMFVCSATMPTVRETIIVSPCQRPDHTRHQLIWGRYASLMGQAMVRHGVKSQHKARARSTKHKHAEKTWYDSEWVHCTPVIDKSLPDIQKVLDGPSDTTPYKAVALMGSQQIQPKWKTRDHSPLWVPPCKFHFENDKTPNPENLA